MSWKLGKKKKAKFHLWDFASEQGREDFREHMRESERKGNDIIMESDQARLMLGIEVPREVDYVALTVQDIDGPKVLHHATLGITVYAIPYKSLRDGLKNKSVILAPIDGLDDPLKKLLTDIAGHA